MTLKKPVGGVNFLVIAFILLVVGIILHFYKENINIKNQSKADSYQAQLKYYHENNIYYDPKATIKWLAERQHPKGYFVENPDSMDEPSQLNRNTLQATRHAVLSLYRLDGIWDMNKSNTINFVYSNYRLDEKNGTEIAGFHSGEGEPLGLRPTMDALLTLWRLNAIDSGKLDLQKIRKFILMHQNEDGGFWDPYYATHGKNSCLRCTSFALSGLGIINSRLNIEESKEFKDKVVKYIKSRWNENDKTYSDTDKPSDHSSFDIFRAYLSLSALENRSIEERIKYAKSHFNLEQQLKTIQNHFMTSSGVFSRKFNSDIGSMKSTHLLTWILTDLDARDMIDQQAVIKFVLANQTSPGEYGGDIYNTYSATSILKRLDVSTKPLKKPEPPKLKEDFVPDFVPYIFYLLSVGAIAFYLLQSKKQLESRTEILESKVQFDNLTGLYNREYLENYFNDNIEEARSLNLILIDIDYFKSINDKHGHLIGDKALQEIASFIQENLRKSDVLARWGGEEFAVICKDTSLKSSLKLAEKLRSLIEQKNIEPIGYLTCSFGLSEYQIGDSFQKLFKKADQAMYRSKNKGRNTISYL